MEGIRDPVTEILYIRNMVCDCCIILLRERLESAGIQVVHIQLGKVVVAYPAGSHDPSSLRKIVGGIGLDILEDRESILVEKIKLTVIELIHHMNNVDSIVRKSDYLVEKLGYSYPYLSRIFSSHEPVTLEKYIILQKIERIKEMIRTDEFTLSEIAYMMDYSSVQYLSNQFHKITGVTVSEFRTGGAGEQKPLDRVMES